MPTSQRFFNAALYNSCRPYAKYNENKNWYLVRYLDKWHNIQSGQLNCFWATNRGSIDSKRAAIISFKPTLTKSQCAEGFVDMTKQFLGSRQSQRHMRCREILHEMRAFAIFNNPTASYYNVTFKRKSNTAVKLEGAKSSCILPVVPKVSMA